MNKKLILYLLAYLACSAALLGLTAKLSDFDAKVCLTVGALWMAMSMFIGQWIGHKAFDETKNPD